MSSSDKIQQQVIFTIFNTIFEDFIMGIISAARIFIASLFNPASISANPSSRPFSGLALNTILRLQKSLS